MDQWLKYGLSACLTDGSLISWALFSFFFQPWLAGLRARVMILTLSWAEATKSNESNPLYCCYYCYIRWCIWCKLLSAIASTLSVSSNLIREGLIAGVNSLSVRKWTQGPNISGILGLAHNPLVVSTRVNSMRAHQQVRMDFNAKFFQEGAILE